MNSNKAKKEEPKQPSKKSPEQPKKEEPKHVDEPKQPSRKSPEQPKKPKKSPEQPKIQPDVTTKTGSLENQCSSIQNQKVKTIYEQLDNVIIFINPKSGGQQGNDIFKKLKNLLPANNIFDLTKGGPKPGLEAHINRKDLKIIVCGGDGTIGKQVSKCKTSILKGWVLSALDEVDSEKKPPVAILPLGTGNDLARILKWGSGYKSKTGLIEKFLLNVVKGPIVKLDRWNIKINPNNDYQNGTGENKLLLNVFNNYFSIGTDAKVALDFHIAREKKPSAFSSQTANQIEYAQKFVGELIKKSCKNLRDSIDVFECDGVDRLGIINERKFHSILFLNIPSYAAGTNPWENDSQKKQSFSDGKLEVIGFKTHDFVFLKTGGHGDNIAQASKIRIVTNSEIPMQVDGEPVLLKPAKIKIEMKNQAFMIKGGFEDVEGVEDVEDVEEVEQVHTSCGFRHLFTKT